MGNFLKQFLLRLLPGAILGLLLIGGIAAIPDSKVERAKESWHILDYPAENEDFYPPQDF
ncbi:MAG: hypothetical protein IM607_07765 [Cytophagales bacterium]|jgi:hypothetical protein|nr:hypothetical protein [Cytophagales bacterium]